MEGWGKQSLKPCLSPACPEPVAGLPTVDRVTEKEEKARNGILLVFQPGRRLRDWSKLATAGVKLHFLLGRSRLARPPKAGKPQEGTPKETADADLSAPSGALAGLEGHPS
jgi:hypothetical protein